MARRLHSGLERKGEWGDHHWFFDGIVNLSFETICGDAVRLFQKLLVRLKQTRSKTISIRAPTSLAGAARRLPRAGASKKMMRIKGALSSPAQHPEVSWTIIPLFRRQRPGKRQDWITDLKTRLGLRAQGLGHRPEAREERGQKLVQVFRAQGSGHGPGKREDRP
jgi:hypothetical protein